MRRKFDIDLADEDNCDNYDHNNDHHDNDQQNDENEEEEEEEEEEKDQQIVLQDFGKLQETNEKQLIRDGRGSFSVRMNKKWADLMEQSGRNGRMKRADRDKELICAGRRAEESAACLAEETGEQHQVGGDRRRAAASGKPAAHKKRRRVGRSRAIAGALPGATFNGPPEDDSGRSSGSSSPAVAAAAATAATAVVAAAAAAGRLAAPEERKKQAAQATNTCAACHKPIRERYLLVALDKQWHEDCLKCACCDCRLGEVGSSLFTHSDKILCRRDFLRIFGQQGNCAACKRSIPPYELVMRANENAYHMDCFNCQQCQYRFCVGDRFHLTDSQRIVCLLCHAELVGQRQQPAGANLQQVAPEVAPNKLVELAEPAQPTEGEQTSCRPTACETAT